MIYSENNNPTIIGAIKIKDGLFIGDEYAAKVQKIIYLKKAKKTKN
jgi:hypothetical protein